MDKMTWRQSEDWRPEIEGYSCDILPWMVEISSQIPHGGTYIEVGVYKGRSFRFMRELRPDLAMIAVDPWTDESVLASHGTGAAVSAEFCRNMSGFGYAAIHGTIDSIPAGVRADIIFIDGDHNYPAVRADIIAAKRIIKPSGILSGHDYAETNGVVCAVNELLGTPNLSDFDGALPGVPVGKGRCWWVRT